MSYEGHEQYLCRNGHLRVFDCYDSPHEDYRCSCGAELVFRHNVDETNGYESPGDHWTFGFPFVVESAPEFKVCDCCGHKKQTKEVTYRIPTGEDRESFIRSFVNKGE